MLDWKTLNSMSKDNDCKGRIVAARVYADVSGNKCSCGCLFSKRVPHDEEPTVIVPRCAGCNKYPPLFHIDADAKDANGANIRVKIRNDQNNDRLEKMSQVLFTLERIQREIKDQSFDVNRYASKTARESFLFKNYVTTYLLKYTGDAEKKITPTKEITPKSLRDKKCLIKGHLLPHFGSMDLSLITRKEIERFRRKFTDRFRTRDLATSELRTILNEAVLDDMLKVTPPFDKIPKANTRTEIISLELARLTIERMPKQLYRDMFTLFLIYGMRPSELRALRWKDIDFIKDEFTVKGHFSDEVWITGRKSVKEGEKASLPFPITDTTRAIFNRYRPTGEVIDLNWQEKYVFTNRFGSHVTDFSFAQAWSFARKNLGHKHHLYELRHRALTEMSRKARGDIVKMMQASGHTNPHTLMTRYIRDNSDMRELF